MSGGTAPDWYPDPFGRHQLRYWDGLAWTSHVADGGAAGEDPPAPVAATPGRAMAPAVEEYADLVLVLAPDAARDAVVHELAAQGFRVTFHDAWNATAERGSKGLNVAFGAFAQYFRISVQIFTGAQGETVVRLLRDPVGNWGGIAGRARVSGMFQRITNDLIDAFHEQGLLAGMAHQG